MIVIYAAIIILSLLITPTVVILFVWYSINDKKIEYEKNKKPGPRDEAELMSIIYSIIEREWTYRVRFHFKLKEITTPKLEFELNYLVKKIMKSMSSGLMDELRYYYTDDAIIKLISEICQIMLLDYMDKNKPDPNNKIRR